MIELLENGNLIVPKTCEENGLIGDGLVEIKKGDPEYDEYLTQYHHDLEIKKMEEELFKDDSDKN